MNFAFVKWYPGSFLEGTAYMSNEEVGAYMRLLCWQAQSGGLPNEFERLKRLADGMSHDTWVAIRDKFEVDEDTGKLVNSRMATEMKAASDRVASGKKAASARWKRGTDATALRADMPPDEHPHMPKKERKKEQAAPAKKEIQKEPEIDQEMPSAGNHDQNVVFAAEAASRLGLDRVSCMRFASTLFRDRPGREGQEWLKDLLTRSKAARSPSAYFKSAVKKEFGL